MIDPTQLNALTEEPIEDYHPSLKGTFRYVKRSDGVVNHVFINRLVRRHLDGRYGQDLILYGVKIFSNSYGYSEKFCLVQN